MSILRRCLGNKGDSLWLKRGMGEDDYESPEKAEETRMKQSQFRDTKQELNLQDLLDRKGEGLN